MKPADFQTIKLIREAQQGNVQAFECLIAKYIPMIRRFAYSFMVSTEEADDLAQEILVRAFQSIRSFSFKSSFSTWLYRIGRNLGIDTARRKARNRIANDQNSMSIESMIDEITPRQDEILVQKEREIQLWEAIRNLPVKFRMVLVLFDIEGFSYEEIAVIEKVPIGTIRSRLARGRKNLQRILQEKRKKEKNSGNFNELTEAHPIIKHGTSTG